MIDSRIHVSNTAETTYRVSHYAQFQLLATNKLCNKSNPDYSQDAENATSVRSSARAMALHVRHALKLESNAVIRHATSR